MILVISGKKTIRLVNLEFQTWFPSLRMDFFIQGSTGLTKVDDSSRLSAAGLTQSGLLELKSDMQVEVLEEIMLSRFGLTVHISRKLGSSWMETSLSGHWSLGKQDQLGQSIFENILQEPASVRRQHGK